MSSIERMGDVTAGESPPSAASPTTSFTYEARGRRWDAHRVFGGDAARILMFPDWEGCHTREAVRLARDFAVTCRAEVLTTDLYGSGVVPDDFGDADRLIRSSLGDPAATRSLLGAMAEALAEHWHEPDAMLVAVGFCFGGSLAFELGRVPGRVRAAISIHGTPHSVAPITRGTTDTTFVMMQGAEDPLIPETSIQAFVREMRQADANWSLHRIGGARHSFTRSDLGWSNHAMGYSRRAEVEARHVTAGLVGSLRDLARGP